MKRILGFRVLCGLLSSLACSELLADEPADDHLVPVHDFFLDAHGPGGAYRRLWQKKLLLTPGDLGRYVVLPAPPHTEGVVSIYQSVSKAARRPPGFWVTVTESSASLWNCISTGSEEMTGRKPADPNTISVQRCDAPLPESTALALRRVWLSMLLRTGPQRDERRSLDASTEIFSAKDSKGRELQGQIPVGPRKNSATLLRLGDMLADYCHLEPNKRPQMARKIEKVAVGLVERLERKKQD